MTKLRETPKLTGDQYNTLKGEWLYLKGKSFDPLDALCVGQPGCADKLAKYLVANYGSPTAFVDYSNPYTINARTPLAGSVNADTKLAADGTLSESSAQIQNQTLQTILSLFPVSEVIQSLATKVIQAGFEEALVKVQLSIERRAIQLTRTSIEDFAVGCPTKGTEVMNNYDVKVEDISPDSNKAAQDKTESNSITVNGTIKLPNQPGPMPTDKPKNK